jgi:hypothetical protein
MFYTSATIESTTVTEGWERSTRIVARYDGIRLPVYAVTTGHGRYAVLDDAGNRVTDDVASFTEARAWVAQEAAEFVAAYNAR